MNGIFTALTIIGSLGLFLYGMKLMSESLQQVAGNKLRDILAAMTSTPLKRILVGTFITAIIQSSSATTVMIISFVNAELITLVQSIGLIMGANIGTTTTAWLISLFGFKVDLGTLAIPLIAFGFPLLFMRNPRTRSFGGFIIGFSLLFLGLDLMKQSMAGLQDDPSVLHFLASFSNRGAWSVLLFVFIGTVLTIIIQSSSATMALTIIMCNNGWIPFDCAAAMVLGENIGTTITANLAAVVANADARRAARAHLIFNLIGVIWMLCIFPYFLKFTGLIVETFGSNSPVSDPQSRPMALALFHTLFNVVNTCILVWFTPQIARLSLKMVRRKKDKPQVRMTHMESGMLAAPELSIYQAYRELVSYSNQSSKMFGFVRTLFQETDPAEFEKTYEHIVRYETISDRLESEMYNYLSRMAQEDMGAEGFGRVQVMFKVISDIEIMSDCSYKLAKAIRDKRVRGIGFTQEMHDGVNRMFDLIDRSILLMDANISHAFDEKQPIRDVYALEKQINDLEGELREKYLYSIDGQEVTFPAGIVFSEIIGEAERLADTIEQISEDILNIVPHTQKDKSDDN
ncbi:MAG: Na/Pi cotransporter family protein [Rikenellaceae bacterium]|jgi:phosphate:Na+ symporter|nr:Na/Pi cotransporter family protein [Rikenellaceae bacterium]